MKALFVRHPKASIIWAHAGLGRIVRPVADQIAMLDRALANPQLAHVNIDLSWDEVAKYVVDSPDTIKATAALIERYPDRFLFGSDVVAPKTSAAQKAVFDLYAPLWSALRPETSAKVRKSNYERIFDAGRQRVRNWERMNAK
jgi:predicted TIM-barrel fold metal-dependent hydrolase